jgi:hypothetical protein
MHFALLRKTRAIVPAGATRKGGAGARAGPAGAGAGPQQAWHDLPLSPRQPPRQQVVHDPVLLPTHAMHETQAPTAPPTVQHGLHAVSLRRRQVSAASASPAARGSSRPAASSTAHDVIIAREDVISFPALFGLLGDSCVGTGQTESGACWVGGGSSGNLAGAINRGFDQRGAKPTIYIVDTPYVPQSRHRL